MYFSAEIRWFHPGPIPSRTSDWFAGNRPLMPQERIDRYLVFPGSESVGVKVRGSGLGKGVLEIKAIQGAPETVQLPRDVSGRADCWAKWSYGEPPAHSLVAALAQEKSGWVAVHKQRWLRTWSLDGGSLVEVDTWESPREGCNLELTALRVDGDDWWTVGFAAFGELETVRGNLLKVAIHFLSHHPPVDRFTTVNSCSYPVWLASV